MPRRTFPPPPPEERPPCMGCDRCGEVHEGKLYAWTRRGEWVCSDCSHGKRGARHLIVVDLTDEEIEIADDVAKRRQSESERRRLKDKHGLRKELGLDAHTIGARGEMAFAVASGLEFEGGVNTFKAPDVGEYQVRTRSKRHYDLIVRDDDSSDDVFVLVTGHDRRFEVHGGIRGRKAKKDKWRKGYGDREPAFFVPKSELRKSEKWQGRS